jgi:hypothetical protein
MVDGETKIEKANALAGGCYTASFALKYAAERKSNKNRIDTMPPEVTRTLEQHLEKRLSPSQIIGRSKFETTIPLGFTEPATSGYWDLPSSERNLSRLQ